MKKKDVFILVLILTGSLGAQNLTLELRDVGRSQITFAGFTLNSKKEISIEALGAGADRPVRKIQNFQQDEHNLFAYAWILNAGSRELVWRMTIDNTEKAGWTEWNRKFKGNLKLDKGDYELYFSAVEPDYFSFDGGFLSFDKIVKKIFRDKDWWEANSADWQISLNGVDEIYTADDVRKYQRKIKESAIIDLSSIKNSEKVQKGFALSQPATVQLYAFGEGYQGKMYDYAWIMDADSREIIWEMKDDHCQAAGGAVKNRMIKENLELAAGNYLVAFKSDDSHSSELWNANPPYDPFFWGISINLSDKKFDPSIVSKYAEKIQQAIVSITRVGDYAYKEEGIEVKQRTKIRIYAIGEGRSGDMFDYGWISDANTGHVVWKMRYNETKHAGGSSKNRLYDDIITLDPGEYIVHYQTDDSHSYEEWNSSKPQDPESWGITLFPVGTEKQVERLKRSDIKSEKILVQLTRIGDNEHFRKQFYLDKPTRLEIKCIGEGDRDEMYDYGWIENVESGETVWKMTYNNSEYAGGATKNRIAETIITLDPGSYRVHFQSDGSHSYNDWNDTPPRQADSWGITIYRLE